MRCLDSFEGLDHGDTVPLTPCTRRGQEKSLFALGLALWVKETFPSLSFLARQACQVVKKITFGSFFTIDKPDCS